MALNRFRVLNRIGDLIRIRVFVGVCHSHLFDKVVGYFGAIKGL